MHECTGRMHASCQVTPHACTSHRSPSGSGAHPCTLYSYGYGRVRWIRAKSTVAKKAGPRDSGDRPARSCNNRINGMVQLTCTVVERCRPYAYMAYRIRGGAEDRRSAEVHCTMTIVGSRSVHTREPRE